LAERRGRLIVIAGPSGVGKGSVVKELRSRDPQGLALSVSATTRAPRAGDVQGRDYFFVTDQEFQRMIAAGELLEWADVFDHRYGTPNDYVESRLREGTDVLLEIDVVGAEEVRRDQASWFDHVVVNDDLVHASSQVAAIIEASRHQRS